MNDVNELREAILDKVRCLFTAPLAPSIEEALASDNDDMLQSIYQALYLALEKDRVASILPPIAIMPDEPTPFVESDQAFEDKVNKTQPTEDEDNNSQNE